MTTTEATKIAEEYLSLTDEAATMSAALVDLRPRAVGSKHGRPFVSRARDDAAPLQEM